MYTVSQKKLDPYLSYIYIFIRSEWAAYKKQTIKKQQQTTKHAITDTEKGTDSRRIRRQFWLASKMFFVYFYSRCNFDREMVMGTA